MMQKRARSEEAKEERKRLLLNAALDEFYEKGFQAARMEDIAGRAGLSKGTLYIYFSSKEEVFHGLIETLTMPNLMQIAAIAKAAPSFPKAIEGFAGLAPHIIRTTDLPRLMKIIIGESQSFPDIVNKYREEVIEQILGIFAGALRAANERGEIVIDDPELTAKLVVAPVILSGLWVAIFEIDGTEALDIEKLLETHVKFLLKAMAP